MGRYEGRRRSALYRRWCSLTSLAADVYDSVERAISADCTDFVLADFVSAGHKEVRELCQAACDLCPLIWPMQVGQMTAYTSRVCWRNLT